VKKIDWDLYDKDGRSVLTRYETPLALWLLDRWFRIPDLVFDRIEWWFPRTSPITRIPCQLYARWFPQMVMRREWAHFDLTPTERSTDSD
jgi:hypothetical protein